MRRRNPIASPAAGLLRVQFGNSTNLRPAIRLHSRTLCDDNRTFEFVNGVGRQLDGRRGCQLSRDAEPREGKTGARGRATAAGAIRADYEYVPGGAGADSLVVVCRVTRVNQQRHARNRTSSSPPSLSPYRAPRRPLPRRSLGRAVSVNCETGFIESTTHEPRRGRPTLRS
ncbi:unnamed protein product, partial [Iphiclides podalirius]